MSDGFNFYFGFLGVPTGVPLPVVQRFGPGFDIGLGAFPFIPLGQGTSGLVRVYEMFYELLNNLTQDIINLNLQYSIYTDVPQGQTPGVSSTITPEVVFRKSLKVEPVVDQIPFITVSKNPEKSIQLIYKAFENSSTIYPLRVNIVSPNTRDWFDHIDDYSVWIDTILQQFSPPYIFNTALWSTTSSSSSVPGLLPTYTNSVYDVRVSYVNVFEPRDMAVNFDTATVDIDVECTQTMGPQTIG